MLGETVAAILESDLNVAILYLLNPSFVARYNSWCLTWRLLSTALSEQFCCSVEPSSSTHVISFDAVAIVIAAAAAPQLSTSHLELKL